MTATERLLSAGEPTGEFFAKIHSKLREAWSRNGPRSELLDECIDIIASGKDLSDEMAADAFKEMLHGDVAADQIGALLVALRPETLAPNTIAVFANVLRENVAKVNPQLETGEILGDTCGTGSDTFGTFNVSTTIMFILAAGGIRIAKHGNRAVTSNCGSADVLQELGARVSLSARSVERCIQEVGIGFMYAPDFHKVLRNLQPIRQVLAREMPDLIQRRTIFNVLGPLANPANADCQIIGVYSPKLVGKFAEVLKLLGLKRALVAHGHCDGGEVGLDEFSTLGKTVVAELKPDGSIDSWEYLPEEACLPRPSDPMILRGANKAYNAQILRQILAGSDEPDRMNLAHLNAGAGLYLAGKTQTIREGVELSRDLVLSGEATRKLDQFIELTRDLVD